MAKKELSLEESLNRLSALVSELESQDVPLNRAMELYQEGIGLIERCRMQLQSAEGRITELRRRADGDAPDEEPLEL